MRLMIMKTVFLMIFSILSVASNEADAKRMGGGSSVGRQSNTVTRNQNALPPKPVAPPVNAAPKPTTPPGVAAPAPTPSRFGGMGGIIGGIAAGIGLSYLFSHMGMGEGVASMFSNILMIGALVFLGLWLFRKFAGKSMNSMMTPSPAGAAPWNATAAQESQTYASSTPVSTAPNMASSQQLPLIPEVSDNALKSPIHAALTPQAFTDKDTFLENAKTLFLQLQEASDQQNLNVLKEYTTPELFDLLRKDMLARTTAISSTQVLTLAADLLSVEEENNEYLASVRFTGSIREEINGPVEDLTEVWNWTKPIAGNTGWLLCGIQQIN